ncbi:hypothetical protein, partial [Pantoea sp. GbtcB22]|uniref:hypothetical protein n=1 Tax=Pantoea sp. GbtcB22 TaxID=2824767 RepID=UPI001C30BE04
LITVQLDQILTHLHGLLVWLKDLSVTISHDTPAANILITRWQKVDHLPKTEIPLRRQVLCSQCYP